MASVDRITAEAMFLVVTRNMTVGRSLTYEQLLDETALEADVLLDESDARIRRQVRKRLLEDRARLAAVAESRAAAERQLADFEMGPGVPTWHPEHSQNDF